jgi:hypothetical protein
MATWVKVLLVIFGLGFVLTLAGGITLFFMVKNTIDPKNVQTVAESLVTFDGPLPERYRYTAGSKIMTMSFVVITDNTDKLLYSIIGVEGDNKAEVTAESLVDGVSKGKNMPAMPNGGGNSTINAKEKGTLDVAGLKMPYVAGTSTSSQGVTVASFFGVAKPKTSGKMIFLMVQGGGADGEDAKAVSKEKVLEFTSHIKAFK